MAAYIFLAWYAFWCGVSMHMLLDDPMSPYYLPKRWQVVAGALFSGLFWPILALWGWVADRKAGTP